MLCRSTLDEICGTACSIRSTPQYRSVMRRVTLCCWNSEWCHSTSFIAGIPIQQRKFFPQIFYFWFVWDGNTYKSASIVSNNNLMSYFKWINTTKYSTAVPAERGFLRRVLRRAYCGLRVLRTADLRHNTVHAVDGVGVTHTCARTCNSNPMNSRPFCLMTLILFRVHAVILDTIQLCSHRWQSWHYDVVSV